MGVALKFYSCVGSNHTTLDAIRAMQEEHPFGADDVERIVVHGSQVTVDHVGWKYVPQGLTVRAAQPAVLRRHAAARRRLLRRPVHEPAPIARGAWRSPRRWR